MRIKRKMCQREEAGPREHPVARSPCHPEVAAGSAAKGGAGLSLFRSCVLEECTQLSVPQR